MSSLTTFWNIIIINVVVYNVVVYKWMWMWIFMYEKCECGRIRRGPFGGWSPKEREEKNGKE